MQHTCIVHLDRRLDGAPVILSPSFTGTSRFRLLARFLAYSRLRAYLSVRGLNRRSVKPHFALRETWRTTCRRTSKQTQTQPKKNP